MQRLILALFALAAIVAALSLAAAVAARLSRRALPGGPSRAAAPLPAVKERPVQKIAFVLLAALVLYVSFGGG